LENHKFVAVTLAGLEDVLAQELIEIGADDVQTGIRAVYFSGDMKMMYRANYFLRTAIRILLPLKTFSIKTVDDLYRESKNMAWEDYIRMDQTFVIHHAVFSDLFKNTMFASLKLKDAIADHFHEKFGKRPSVSTQSADIYINLHIANESCTISLDSSGESLHKRGYRVAQNEAPINEVLAAGLIKLSGWDMKQDFLDPMCGSGTIAIEAALLAKNIAPGEIRKNFAFQKWKSFRREAFRIAIGEPETKKLSGKILAADMARAAIDIAWNNAEAAGVLKDIKFKIANFKLLDPEMENPFLLFNPPYGERMEPEEANFYSMIGERLKHHYENATACIISTSECFKTIGLKPSQKIDLMNGSIECSFRKFELYKGSKKEAKPE